MQCLYYLASTNASFMSLFYNNDKITRFFFVQTKFIYIFYTYVSEYLSLFKLSSFPVKLTNAVVKKENFLINLWEKLLSHNNYTIYMICGGENIS